MGKVVYGPWTAAAKKANGKIARWNAAHPVAVKKVVDRSAKPVAASVP
jgi:hypothetical protein